MKKYIALAAFAAVLLCGCADDEGTTSTSRQSSSTSTSSTSTSSTGLDPLYSELFSDIPESGTSYYSGGNNISHMTITKKKVYPAEKTFIIPSHTHLYIKNGGEFTVEGKFDAREGCEISIESGCALILNGESSLNCDLHIEEGGKLIVGENGKVSGSGTIYAFSNDCIENSQNVETSIKVTG